MTGCTTWQSSPCSTTNCDRGTLGSAGKPGWRERGASGRDRSRLARTRDAGECPDTLDPAHQPASSWHTRNTGGETGRFSRAGPGSRGVAAGTTARRPSGSSGWRRSPGTSSIRPDRAGRSMRTTVCRSARHSTPPPVHSRASTRPGNATVSAVQPPLRTGSPGNLRLERAAKTVACNTNCYHVT